MRICANASHDFLRVGGSDRSQLPANSQQKYIFTEGKLNQAFVLSSDRGSHTSSGSGTSIILYGNIITSYCENLQTVNLREMETSGYNPMVAVQ